MNVDVLFARVLDEEGESFLPFWIDSCVASLGETVHNESYE